MQISEHQVGLDGESVPPPAYKPAHKKTSDCQGCERVVEARRFVVETLIACRCSFQRQPLSAGHFLARAECRAPRVFVWVLFCMLSVYACLIPIPLFFSYLNAHFLREHLRKLSKTYNLLTKSVGQFFHSPKRKKKKEATGDLDASSQALYSHAAPQKEFLCCVK